MDRSDDSSVLTRRVAAREESAPSYVERDRNIVISSELLRNAGQPARAEEKLSVFWRVFGGTILSISALVCLTVYQSLNGNITEVRNDQNRLREHAADFVKKDELSSRTDKLWTNVRELQGLNSSVTVTNTKVGALEQRLATAEAERKELAKELQNLRERLAKLEGTKAAGDAKAKE